MLHATVATHRLEIDVAAASLIIIWTFFFFFRSSSIAQRILRRNFLSFVYSYCRPSVYAEAIGKPLLCNFSFNDLPQRCCYFFTSFYLLHENKTSAASYAHVHGHKVFLILIKFYAFTLTKITFFPLSLSQRFEIIFNIFFFCAKTSRYGSPCFFFGSLVVLVISAAVFFSIMLKWCMENIASVHYELQLKSRRKLPCSLNAWIAREVSGRKSFSG